MSVFQFSIKTHPMTLSTEESSQQIFSRQMSNIETTDDILSGKTPRELGIIEKLCPSYGFVYCCHRDGRYFFHFSEYKSDIQQAKIGGNRKVFR